jgi:serine/threonine protein phosphatase PrpC
MGRNAAPPRIWGAAQQNPAGEQGRIGHYSMDFLQKFWSRERPNSGDAHHPSVAEADYPISLASLPPGLTVAKISDIGQVRERNEDAYLAIDLTLQNDDGLVPLGLYVVADGMGGHQKGEIASSLAAQVSARNIMQDVFLPFLSSNEENPRRPINEALIQAVQSANLAVYRQVPEAGTTLTMALVFGHKAYVAHVGDSRAYIYNQATLRQITHDHSLVARLVELGQATPEEALTHTHRNVLYRAIGQAGSLEVDTYLQPFPVGSCLLLCSDGLWGMISDDEIADILTYAPTPQQALARMVALANQKGGDDNITALLVFMGEA